MTDIQNIRNEDYPFNDAMIPKLVLKSACKLGNLTCDQRRRLTDTHLNFLHTLLLYNGAKFAEKLFDAAFAKGYIYSDPLKTLSILEVSLSILQGQVAKTLVAKLLTQERIQLLISLGENSRLRKQVLAVFMELIVAGDL